MTPRRPPGRPDVVTTAPEVVLQVRDATKRFGGVMAVQGISFEAAPGRDRRADRAERGGEDDADQPDHRRRRGRPTGTITFEGRSLNGLRPHASGGWGSPAPSRWCGRSPT